MNIAILTMSLNIGGAETHIYELSCALAAKGHKVTVFSAGGVYADKLKEQGIEHILTPLNSKNPKHLIGAYKLIENYVKHNRPCVLHSHTRISNFTANMIAKKYNIPFVSTIHFNFRTGILQKFFSKWGDRAIAVSEDLKQYAIDNYGFEGDKISITVNGINLNTFSKNELPELREELGIEKDSKVILCVSRLDEVAGDHVFKVLSLAQKIYNNDKNTNIVIVGGGSRIDEFKKLTESINSKTKPGFIKMAGPQTEIYRYCNIADLFIGISRSALEAMACKVPVILLGNSGYIGLYSKETEADCIDTNFTCRGCPFPEGSVITELIHDMLNNPDKYAENVENAYTILENRYSVERMANDALDAYTKAYNDLRPFDAMICGYYGRSNLGDDILLKVITDNLKIKCGAKKFALLTADPKNNPGNIDKCIHRFNIFSIYKYMKKCRTFILGGGSILQDSTSSRSLYYYLFVSKLAKKLGCGVMLYSNGIGPINKKDHRRRVADLLEKANYITVRDKKSFDFIREMGVKNPNAEVTADEVFSFNSDFANVPYLPADKKYFCINLRSSSSSQKLIDSIADAAEKLADTGYIPVLLPLHFDQDIEVLKKLSAALKCEHILIDERLSHYKTLSILNQSYLVLAQRLHAVIFSCIFRKPFIALNYDPKIKSICIELDMTTQLATNDVSADKLYDMLKSTIESSDDIIRKLDILSNKKSQTASKNAEIANKVLG